MSAFDVLRTYGTARLLRFTTLVALFCVLHLIRLPFLLIGMALTALMRGVDAAVTTVASAPAPPRPPRYATA